MNKAIVNGKRGRTFKDSESIILKEDQIRDPRKVYMKRLMAVNEAKRYVETVAFGAAFFMATLLRIKHWRSLYQCCPRYSCCYNNKAQYFFFIFPYILTVTIKNSPPVSHWKKNDISLILKHLIRFHKKNENST